jgi:hypothetical protein
MFFRRMWDAVQTSRRTHGIHAATQRECALKEEFARHVRGLESQILLLRAENRALLNSVLGIAGIPPIMVTDPAEFPGGGREAKQIPRTASRAPEKREKSNSVRDDSSRDDGCRQDGTASLQTDSVENASHRIGAPNGSALPSLVAGSACPAGRHSVDSPSLTTSAVPLGRQNQARGANAGRIVAPMRRRSWHQIYRMLELESVRRKDSDV